MSSPNDYSTATDFKNRFGGILENPYVSKIHRHCLDGFKVTGLRRILQPFQLKNILDVGCGLGEYSHLNKGRYIGVDNSFPRVRFAQRQYAQCNFIQSDATTLPFKDNAFEAVLLANTAHHLSDEQLAGALENMKRVSHRYLIIDDCIRTPQQSQLSRYFYSLDRGTMFRTLEQFDAVFQKHKDLTVILRDSHVTFPGLYAHAVYVLEVKKSRN